LLLDAGADAPEVELEHVDGVVTRAPAATLVAAVSWTALTASVPGLLGVALGVDAEGDGEVLPDGDELGCGDGDSDGAEDGGGGEGCAGFDLLQVGDGDGLAVDPDRGPWNGDDDAAAGAFPPGRGGGLPGCEFELLGDTAVETSIATYVPAATMNMTVAIAASGRSQPWVRERCLPGICTGAKRSQASRNSARTR
jgi:hypothetical protein